MDSALNEQILSEGFGFMRHLKPELDTQSIGSELGKTLTPWPGGLVQELVPKADAPPNTYSGIYGLGGFPFHTDLAHWKMPPRYLMLRCLKGYRDVPTLLLDGGEFVGDDEVRNILARAVVRPRRPQNGTLTLLRLLENQNNCDLLRWDEVFLQPASRVAEEANQLIRAWLGKQKPRSIVLEGRGDTLIIDNWRMLHARSYIASDRTDRKIERIYMEELY